jgi:DNA-binding transcriptional ArsR family regulator
MSALLRALNTPRRREILRLVWDGERTAGEIHRAFGDVTFGAVSQHLRVLVEAELVTRRSAGRHRYYLAQKEELGALREWLESMWDSALDGLALAAELEAARRGPRARRRGRKTRTRTTPVSGARRPHR